jgi:diguanylate cyclase (GGDEF)-like protein
MLRRRSDGAKNVARVPLRDTWHIPEKRLVMPVDKLIDEQGRLAALRRYQVLDTPPEAGFDTITNLVRLLLGVPMSAVSLIDKDRQWLKSRQGLPVDETSRDVAFCQYTIRQAAPLVVEDASRDERFCDNPLVKGDPHIASYAGVPLQTPDGYNIGALCAIDTEPRIFDATQMEVLNHLAVLVVEYLELRNLAGRDSLTGALTRGAFMAELDKSLSLFARQQQPATLIMMDIDHFKQVNDRFGHPAGDRAIAAVANACHQGKRPSDSFGRLGGEEFGLLLPGTEKEEAIQIAERLREQTLRIKVPNDPPFALTASFGVATLDADCVTRQAILEAADGALYQAKRSGRNRVCVAATTVSKAA